MTETKLPYQLDLSQPAIKIAKQLSSLKKNAIYDIILVKVVINGVEAWLLDVKDSREVQCAK